MRRYQFLDGLDGGGLDETLEAWTEKAPWTVHSMGHNNDGFWILFEAPNDTRGS